MHSIKAIFFDRDGTLIHEKPGTYLCDPNKVRLYAPVKKSLQRLAKAGFHFFIVSNQSGIGRGYFTSQEVNKVHVRLQEMLSPVVIEEIVFCPHAPEEKCNCRKPATALGENLIQKYNINPKRSFMVGDKKADVLFGQTLGFRSVLMTTANGKTHLKKYPDLKPDFIAQDMAAAARYILQEDQADD
ncbi:MAG: HAD-IIIA family hydrolase [Elusimicrobiaceae bacterium]|nr:HAD-IIIA family hydrolase [Elusimicrobiaceae bacterium]